MRTTEPQENTDTELAKIAWLSAQDPQQVFHSLLHHINVRSLGSCFDKLDGKRASGADGITKEHYGFTFYLGKSKRGAVIPKLKTDGKRMRAKLKAVNAWARQVRNKYRLKEIWRIFCAKLKGHIQYFGVSFNSYSVEAFTCHALRIMFKWLNRRSQRKSFTWDKFEQFMEKLPPPKAKIYHKLF